MTGWQQKLDVSFDEITFFFSLPLLSSIAAAADNNIRTRISGSEHKKNEILFFFSFTLFYFSLYSAVPAATISRWCSCFFRERHNGERTMLVLALAPQQATVYRFARYYRLLLCLSFSPFVNSVYMHAHSFFPYTCHCGMFHVCMHKCTSQANESQ